MSSSLPLLLIETRQALLLSQGQLAEMMGVVKRTMQRWEDRGAILLPSHIQTLATAVHPKDPALAARIAAYGNTSLEALGLVKPAPPAPPPAPPAPPPPAPLPTSLLVDSIVCVAADAIGLQPRAIRPALEAAFVRAREVRLDVGAVADSLTGAGTAPKPRPPGRRAPRGRP